MIPDQESIQRMIHDTVSLLCRNTLSHDVAIRIQGLIGVTVDESKVFLVQFDESYGSDVSGTERSKQRNLDGASSPNASMTDPPKSNARKRPRLSEATDPATPCDTSAQQSAAVEGDCDVIFVADEVSDNHVKLEFDQFRSFVDNNFQAGDSSQTFKTEDAVAATDLNVYADNRENQRSQVKHVSAGNTLLRNMLASRNSYMPDQATSWQSHSVSYEGLAVPTASVTHEQATSRPRIKQVVTEFIGITVSKHGQSNLT